MWFWHIFCFNSFVKLSAMFGKIEKAMLEYFNILFAALDTFDGSIIDKDYNRH